MKRRTFLQTTGLALTAVPAAAEQKSPAAAVAPPVLVTAAHRPLAQAVTAALASSYRVTLTSTVDTHGKPPSTPCDLFDATATAALVRGMTAIIHLPDPAPETAGAALIDYRTRATYGLLQAAVREGVSSVVYLSSLDVMLGHEASYQVSEDWRPAPGAEPGPLSDHLGEFTCREFAREGKLRVIVLRLGRLAQAEPSDPLRLALPDAVQAVSRALAALLAPRPPLEAWSVFHIVSDLRSRRFSPAKAYQRLGYRPQASA